MLRSLFSQRRLIIFAVLSVVAVCVWFFGPYLQFNGYEPFGSVDARIIFAGALFLGWLFWNLIALWRAKRASKRILEGLIGNEKLADMPPSQDEEEIRALRDKMAAAVAAQKELLGKDKNIYSIPWYLIIGPPGSGKTSFLMKSGLHFPLSERLEGGSGLGLAGTGNCDWSLTDQAMLLDTAGRYTIQDQNRTIDALAWRTLLTLLLEHRPRQPLNGVIITLPADLLQDTPPDSEPDYVKKIRTRLFEIQKILNITIPLYLVINKLDLVPGFSETYSDFDHNGRAQLLGIAMPLNLRSNTEVTKHIKNGLNQLNDLSLARVPYRLHEEGELGRRSAIFAFPHEIQRLFKSLTVVAENLFFVGKSATPVTPRGIFLTSATGGAAMSEAARVQSNDFFSMMKQQPAAALVSIKPFFLESILSKFVFAEAKLAGRNNKTERRLALLHAGGYALSGGVLLLLASIWSYQAYNITGLLNQADRHAVGILGESQQNPTTEQAGIEWGILDQAYNLMKSLDPGGIFENVVLVGLPGTGESFDEANEAYTRLLATMLLPALASELEIQIGQAIDRNDMNRLRTALTVYLMLGDPGRYSSQVVRGWISSTIEQYVAADQQMRQSVTRHFGELEYRFYTARIARSSFAISTDSDLIRVARSRLVVRPQAERIYDQLKREAENNNAIPRLDVTQSLGWASAQLISLRAQAGLPLIVPGFYTRNGFYKGFLERLPHLTLAQGTDDWVTGSAAASDPAAMQQLVQQITNRYVQDYTSAWQTVLEQTRLANFNDFTSAVGALQQLAAPDSPVIALLGLLRFHTELSPPGLPTGAGGGVVTSLSLVSQLTVLLGGGEQARTVNRASTWPGDRIRAPFANLVALVDTSAGAPPINRVQDSAAAAFAMANGIATAQSPAAAAHAAGQRKISGQSTDALSNLQASSTTLPSPVSRIYNDVSLRNWTQIMRLALESANAAWTRDLLPICERSIADRFPIVFSSSREIPLQDFRSFFGPEGAISKFIQNNLNNFIVWRAGKYEVATMDGISLQLSREALDNLGKARAIQDAFFGSGNLQFRFSLTPHYLDPAAIRSLVEVDQIRLLSAHDPPRSVEVTWPGNEASVVQLSITGIDGKVRVDRHTGPWALFKFVRAGLPTGRGESFLLNMQMENIRAQYMLKSESAVNPMAIRELQGFQCAQSL